jgi:hypothetical protein
MRGVVAVKRADALGPGEAKKGKIPMILYSRAARRASRTKTEAHPFSSSFSPLCSSVSSVVVLVLLPGWHAKCREQPVMGNWCVWWRGARVGRLDICKPVLRAIVAAMRADA